MRFFAKDVMRPFRQMALWVALLMLTVFPAHAEVKIQEVISDKGIRAWLVEDYTVPIITIQMSFRGGAAQDPAGKEGLANLMTGLFDEGAGEMDSDAFQEKLDEIGAEMSFSEDQDTISGTMRMLAENSDEAFAMLHLALTRPRFDPVPVARIRDQIIAGIRSDERDPSTRAAIAWGEGLYGLHPYARRTNGTEASLMTITSEDLKTFHKAQFARDNLHIGVVGAIDAETLRQELDKLFADLPEKAKLTEIPPAAPQFGQQLAVDYDLPQTSIRIAYPGVKRENPDFYAAYVMSHILGGGTFSSRLYDEVREKRGLAYGIGAWLASRDYSAELQISTATRSDRAQETLSVILDEVRKMAEDGASEAELSLAKKYIKGSYAISNFANSSAIANALVGIQEENLGIDYINKREDYIDSVTLDQVKQQAQELLMQKPLIMLVGPAAARAETEPTNSGG